MGTVSVNPPKTPVTKGSNTVAAATVPNVCKMPGPPAPFVPTPLPNIGRSSLSPENFSTSVTFDGKAVAIRGATFASQGDLASKGTGGGLVSSNTHGITKFVGPGSLDVQIEGKNVQLLSDPMLNNCGPSGSPANAATLAGAIHVAGPVVYVEEQNLCPICDEPQHELAESEASTASAQGIVDALSGEFTRPDDKFSTMVGVALCNCDKYADHSGGTCEEFTPAAAGHQTRESTYSARTTQSKSVRRTRATGRRDCLRRALVRAIGDEALAAAVLQDAVERAETGSVGHSAANLPGSCAAQTALILVLERNHKPTAMTEKWFSSRRDPCTQSIAFVRIHLDGTREHVPPQQIQHGASAPPCETCGDLLRYLICPKNRRDC